MNKQTMILWLDTIGINIVSLAPFTKSGEWEYVQVITTDGRAEHTMTLRDLADAHKALRQRVEDLDQENGTDQTAQEVIVLTGLVLNARRADL